MPFVAQHGHGEQGRVQHIPVQNSRQAKHQLLVARCTLLWLNKTTECSECCLDVHASLLHVTGPGGFKRLGVGIVANAAPGSRWCNTKLVWGHRTPASADVGLPQIFKLVHALMHVCQAAAHVVELVFQALIFGTEQGVGCLLVGDHAIRVVWRLHAHTPWQQRAPAVRNSLDWLPGVVRVVATIRSSHRYPPYRPFHPVDWSHQRRHVGQRKATTKGGTHDRRFRVVLVGLFTRRCG